MAASTEPVTTSAVQPMTGAEYLESIRDGREIWIYGERVKDVTTHPAFRNTARMIARLYDALHDPERKDVLTTRDRHGQRRLHAPVLQDVAQRRGPRRRARRDRRVGAHQLRLDRPQPGLQGGVPRHARRQLRLLRPVSRRTPGAGTRRSQEDVPFVNHAIVNPPIDRDKPLDEVKDVYMHVEKETDAGLVVSGAKVVATTSTLTHFNFIAQQRRAADQDEGVRVRLHGADGCPRREADLPAVLRDDGGRRMGTPFDYPLSSRMDENDSILIFDKVFVPWENVFAYGDIDKVNNFFPRSGFLPALHVPGLHAARRQARLHRRPAAQGRRGDRRRRTSAACRRRSAKCSRGATSSGA